jgi:hypothetical protein
MNAPSPDDFQITYAAGAFTLDYERKAGGPVTSSFTVAIQGLVEWFGANEGELNHSAIVGYLPLGATGFGEFPLQHLQTTTSTGVVVHSFLIENNLQDIRLNLTIADGFVQVAPGMQLTPMEGELTISLAYVMSPSATRLALQLGLSTNLTASQSFTLDNQSWDEEHQFSQNERAINVTNDAGPAPSFAFFAWSNSATVNGQLSSVDVIGPLTNTTAGGYDLYLSYPRVGSVATPSEVLVEHDPFLGVVSAAYQSIVCCGAITTTPPPSIQGDLTLYVVSMVAAAGLVAGTAIVARRRRREGL